MSWTKLHALVVVAAFATAGLEESKALDIQTIQITSGSESIASHLSVDAAGRAHITYSNDPWVGFWTFALGYAVVATDLLSIESQNDSLIEFNHSGAAQILSHSDGRQVLFHHRWLPLEEYAFVVIDGQGEVATDIAITSSGGCTNTDSGEGAVRFADDSFGLVYTSCRGTGINESERNNLWYTRWDADGAEIVPDLLLDSSTMVEQGAVSATVDALDRVHIAYVDWSDGTSRIYYQRTDSNGIAQVSRTLVETSVGSVGFVDVAVDPTGELQLVWTAVENNESNVYRMALNDEGIPLELPDQVSELGTAILPQIQIDSASSAHILWTEVLADSQGVYYTKFDASNAPLVPVTQLNTVSARCRSFEVDAEGTAHATWTTGTGSGTGDVHYARVRSETSSTAPPASQAVNSSLQVSPNPFVQRTGLRFELPESARVQLTINDAGGRLVHTVVSTELEAGPHEFDWKGADEVSAGVYFARLQTPNSLPVETKLTRLSP